MKGDAIQMYVLGKRPSEIAKRIGVSHATVCRWIKNAGLETRYKSIRRAVMRDAETDPCATRRSLANKYGLNYQTVCRWFREEEAKAGL